MTAPRDTLKRAAELLREQFNLKSEVAAALDRMAEQEPVAVRKWHAEFKCWNYDDIEDVLPTHTGERLYAAPVAPADDARDAERLDWLDAHPRTIVRSGKQSIRALIDAAMKEPK